MTNRAAFLNQNKKGLTILLSLPILLSEKALTQEVIPRTKSIMHKICLASFKSEMMLSNKKPPKGMGSFTCQCFSKKISQASSIAAAKEFCKKEALNRYKL